MDGGVWVALVGQAQPVLGAQTRAALTGRDVHREQHDHGVGVMLGPFV